MTKQPSSTPLLQVRNLSVAFQQNGQTNLAVNQISFDLRKGVNFGSGRGIRVWQIGLGPVDPEIAALSGCLSPIG